MIHHLILSGGGHNIVSMLGAIGLLLEKKYLNIGSLKTIDATSAGTMLAFMLMVGMECKELENYFLNRPWEKVFNISPELIFQCFQNKGIFGKETFSKMLDPILKSCNVDPLMTMAELNEKTGIEFTIYVTELNNLKLVSLSHLTHPKMEVIEAIYQSCAVPPLFKPVVEGEHCYLDGGVFANYPLHCFLERNPEVDKNTVFGIKLKQEQVQEDNIQQNTNITEYFFTLMRKLIQHIVIHREHNVSIPNELLIYTKGMSFETLKRSIQSREERQMLLSEGRRYASVYHIYKTKE